MSSDKQPTGPTAPMAPMAATGTSASTIKAAVNHVRIGNLFLEHISKENADLSARWGKDFLKVPETEICTEYFFGMVATYLASVYISEGGASKGNHISSTTAELYFNALLNMTKERLRLSTQQQTQVMCTPAHSLAHMRMHMHPPHRCPCADLPPLRHRANLGARALARQHEAPAEHTHLPAPSLWR